MTPKLSIIQNQTSHFYKRVDVWSSIIYGTHLVWTEEIHRKGGHQRERCQSFKKKKKGEMSERVQTSFIWTTEETSKKDKKRKSGAHYILFSLFCCNAKKHGGAAIFVFH